MNNSEQLARLKNIELFVLDMDGTIYLGDNPIEGAKEFCHKISVKKKLIYFTNNASKSPDDYVKKLQKLEFPVERKNLVTSGDVTAAYLNKYHFGESVYLVGTKELEKNFKKSGIILSENSKIVVVSFDLSLTYEKLEKACTLIRNGAKFYSTHPDVNCPTENGFIPDSGAICAAVSLSTGIEPKFFGKPHAETCAMIEEISKIKRDKIAIVGDRLYTDIALGKKNGILSILVMTGETTPEMLKCTKQEDQPDLIFDRISDIENKW